jgi:hypothetical protein
MTHVVEKDWITKAGLRAVCVFANGSHRCGYVAVRPSSPFYKKGYYSTVSFIKSVGDIPLQEIGKRGIIPLFCFDKEKAPSLELLFDVHGGLTFSGQGEDYPVPGENLWWFGFDAAHAGDWTNLPGSLCSYGVERTLEYMENECESLASQLVDYALLEKWWMRILYKGYRFFHGVREKLSFSRVEA